MEDYKKVAEKDKALGKDFNNAAYDEMKRNRYYFEYLRTQERLYHYELEKNQKSNEVEGVKEESKKEAPLYKTEAQDRQKRIIGAADNSKSTRLIKEKQEEMRKGGERYAHFR